MSIAFDNTFLTLLLDPSARVRPNPATGKKTPHLKGKMNSLLDALSERRETLIIPTPALAEVMCRVRPADEVISKLGAYKCIEPFSFDQKCAITLADMMCKRREDVVSARRSLQVPKQTVKFDLQIVAVAATYGADTLYTDDDEQTVFAEMFGLKVIHTWELTLSAKYAQGDLFEQIKRETEGADPA